VTWQDVAGLIGVAMMLVAYAGAQARKLDPLRSPALLMNLVGAGLVLLSLTAKFNLAAFMMEASWALVAAWGLVRLVMARRPKCPSARD
jgi:hypothetical protein